MAELPDVDIMHRWMQDNNTFAEGVAVDLMRQLGANEGHSHKVTCGLEVVA